MLPQRETPIACASSHVDAGNRGGWFCSDLRHQRQQAAWCVPASLSMMSPRVFGRPVAADSLAWRWGQRPGQSFDFASMYPRFKAFCLQHRIVVEVDYSGEVHRRDWAWFQDRGTPIMAAVDGHAFVCAGARSFTVERTVHRRLCVLDPGERSRSWKSLPACGSLGLAFAFRARLPRESA